MFTSQIEPLPDSRVREEIAKMMAVSVKLSAAQAHFNAGCTKSVDRWWVPLASVAIAFMAGAGLAAVAIHFAR